MIETKTELFPITISLKTRIAAAKFSRYHLQTSKAKQVYLNTLATAAVNSYLNFIGWSTSLENSDSQNPVLQTMMNVRDIQIPDYGKVECCSIVPGQESIVVSPEIWTKRIAYILVELEQSLNQAKVLGFLPQINKTSTYLSEFKSLAQFPAYLSQQRKSAKPSTSNLSTWFAGMLDQGWQKVEDLFPNPPALNFRNSRKLLDSLGESLSPDIDGVKLITLSDSLEYSMALIIKLQAQNNGDFNVSIIVCNRQTQDYLPEGLEILIIDEINHPVMIAQANQTETIEFCFSGKSGERFSIEMSLGDQVHLESFTI